MIKLDFQDPFETRTEGSTGILPLTKPPEKQRMPLDFQDPYEGILPIGETGITEAGILPTRRRVQIPQATTQPQITSEEESWPTIVGKSVMGGLGQIGTGLMGVAKAGLETVGVETPGIDEITQAVTEYWTPKTGESTAKKYGAGILQSTAQSLPLMLTGPLALPLIGATSGGNKYLQLRDMGQDIKTSLAVGIPIGIFEAYTEKLPIGALTKVGTPLVKRLLTSAALELPGEQINTLVESIADKMTIRPEMTVKDYLNDFVDTAITTIGQTLLTGGLIHGVVGGPEKAPTEPRPEVKSPIEGFLKDIGERFAPTGVLPITTPIEEVTAEVVKPEEKIQEQVQTAQPEPPPLIEPTPPPAPAPEVTLRERLTPDEMRRFHELGHLKQYARELNPKELEEFSHLQKRFFQQTNQIQPRGAIPKKVATVTPIEQSIGAIPEKVTTVTPRGIIKEEGRDLVDILKSMGGLNPKDKNIDVKAITPKEMGIHGAQTILRKSQKRTLDEMREDILAEARLNPNTSTDELFGMIQSDLETRVELDLERKRTGKKTININRLTEAQRGQYYDQLMAEEQVALEVDKTLNKPKTIDNLTSAINNEIINLKQEIRHEARGIDEEERAAIQALENEALPSIAEIEKELADFFTRPEPTPREAVSPEIAEAEKELGITRPNLPLEERVEKLKRAGYPEEAERLREAELSPTEKDQIKLPSVKIGVEERAKEPVKPTLEGTPLGKFAREEEVKKVQPSLKISEKVEPEARKEEEIKPEGKWSQTENGVYEFLDIEGKRRSSNVIIRRGRNFEVTEYDVSKGGHKLIGVAKTLREAKDLAEGKPTTPPAIEGLIYNGIQKGIEGIPDQYVFTDEKTESSFFTTDISKENLVKEKERIRGKFEGKEPETALRILPKLPDLPNIRLTKAERSHKKFLPNIPELPEPVSKRTQKISKESGEDFLKQISEIGAKSDRGEKLNKKEQILYNRFLSDETALRKAEIAETVDERPTVQSLEELKSKIEQILPKYTTLGFVDEIRIDLETPGTEDTQRLWSELLDMPIKGTIKIGGVTRIWETSGLGFLADIEVATRGFGQGQIEENAYHEAWHSIRKILLNKDEIAIVDKKYANAEAQAEAFADFAMKKKKPIPLSVKTIFEKIKGFFEAFGNYLRGKGFNSAEDIFGKAFEGKITGQAKEVAEARREAGVWTEKEISETALRIISEKDVKSPEKELLKEKKSPFDLVGKFKEAYTLNLTDKDISLIKPLVSNPWDMAQDGPKDMAVMNVTLNRMQTRQEIMHHFLSNTVKKSASKVHEFLALPRKEQANILSMIVWCDANNEFFHDISDEKGNIISHGADELRKKAKELGLQPLSNKQVSAYYAWHRTTNAALNLLIEHQKDIIFKPYEDEKWFNELKTLAMIETAEGGPLFTNEQEKTEYQRAIGVVNNLSTEERKKFDRAMERPTKPVAKIKELRSEIGRIKFYFPRTREEGKYVLLVKDKEGNLIHSWSTDSTLDGKRKYDELKKTYPEFTVEKALKKNVPEFVFMQVSDIATQKFIERAIDKLKKNEQITPEEADALNDALLEAISEQLKSRGFAKRMIKRREGRVITGYETEDGAKILMDYISGMAGFITKQDAALDYYKALQQIDMKTQPNRFAFWSRYIQDMLRNTTKVDRISGKIRGIASAWYILGNLKFVPVQFTQNFVTGIPVLGRETKGADYKYVKAMKDVAFDKLSKEERQAMDVLVDRGITMDQFMQEVRGKTKGVGGEFWTKLVDVLYKPFSGMEIYNRKSAGMAMFRVARYEKGMSFEDAVNEARNFIYNTHFLYGEGNLPEITRGGSPGAVTARTLYTFRTFTHNYLLLLKRTLRNKDGKIALDVMGRSLAYVALFGGVGALPFLDDFLDEWEKIFGTPVRKQMREGLKGIGGEMLEKFGMDGLPALIGINLSGSLKIEFPFKPSAESIYGVYGGLYDKSQRMMDAFSRDDILRAIETGSPVFLENLFKAERMYAKGATTERGKVMFDEMGKPIKLTGLEAAGQAIGLRPEKMAVASQERRTFQNIENHYREKRDNLYSKFRLAENYEERQKVAKEIQDYNLDVMKYKGAIPIITKESLRQAFKQQPKKSMMKYQRSYAE